METITITASATFPTELVEARATTLGWNGIDDVKEFMEKKVMEALTTLAAGDQIEQARRQVLQNIADMQAQAEQQVRDAVAPAITINIE
jgi:hypothetical protein